MNNSKIKIALVDDHILLRNALAELINREENFQVLFTADHGKQMIEKINVLGKPEIIVLDLNMPEMDGYETTEWLAKLYPDILIMVLTMFDTDIPLIRLLKTGVKGFLKKDIHPDELMLALNELKKDGFYYPVQTVGKMANLFRNNMEHEMNLKLKSLSFSDIEFLKLVCTDLTYKEIALQLNISPKTIDALREHLFNRFEVKSRVGLAMYAIKNGVVSL
jgi:two-component system, NarL family, invasion response regulator UvrY